MDTKNMDVGWNFRIFLIYSRLNTWENDKLKSTNYFKTIRTNMC